MIIAKGREIKEFSEIISIEEQITNLNYIPEQDYKKEININAFNAVTGEGLSNVFLRLRKCNSKISSEGLTKSQGDFMYTIDANCLHFLEVERKGFIPYFLEINQTKGNEDNNVVKVPMFPIEKIKKKLIKLSEEEEETEVKPLKLRALLVSDDLSSTSMMVPYLHASVTNPENNEEEEIKISNTNTSTENDYFKAEFTEMGEYGRLISLETIPSEHTNKWFRITASFGSHDLTDPETFVLDQNFKNTLQDHNAKMLIFDDRRLISIVYAPCFISNATHWDIGFINPSKGRFIKVNASLEVPIGLKTYTRFFMRFYKFLNEEGKNFNLKSNLGFEGESCILKGDDHVLTDENDFIKAVKSLEINWISDNLKDEKSTHEDHEYDDRLHMREAELNNFYPALANGFKNLFGEISLKKVLSGLEPHIGVNQISPQKLHRTISKTARRIYF